MNCNETRPLLNAYMDSELDLVRSLDVERHLKSCSACVTAKRSLQSLHSALRHSDLAYRAPESLRERISHSIEKKPAKPQRRDSRPWLWQWLALGAMGFAVLTLALHPIGISQRDQLADEAISGHVRSLLAGHLMDVASTDQHTVKPWFNGKIDFAPEVKDFAAQGFPLVGGRLDYLNNQTVAALVYRRAQHTINVFVWPEQTVKPETTETRRGYSIINRNINGLRYCIVSDLNAKELADFAALF